MYYYKYKDKYLFSVADEYEYEQISEETAFEQCKELYFLIKLEKGKSRKSFCISSASDLYMQSETLDVLRIKDEKNTAQSKLPEVQKLLKLIEMRKVKAVNTSYDDWAECLFMEKTEKKRVNLFALGDVGSTLLTGLRLIGGSCIGSIGIYDRSADKVKRWEYEMNQTSSPFGYDDYPEVEGIAADEMFNCDMFVFCASKGVPPVGSNVQDVRMIQFEENKKIISEYASKARNANFKGIFAVVSDPVDPLCKAVYLESNKNDDGHMDYKGLAPEQIKGYGLGVMNARALYYAKMDKRFADFSKDGRAFGPHGKDLIIANSISNYDDELSKELTELAVNANIEVRKTGFKPYVAPALSSGAISIECTLSGKWHYSSNYIGGVYFGSNNRMTAAGIEWEKINMNDELFQRLSNTYENLKQII